MQVPKVFASSCDAGGLNESKCRIAPAVLSSAISRAGRHVLFAVLGGLAVCPAWAANFTVINLADSGAGTLRQAILDANASADPFNTIAIPAGTITLGSNLPDISQSIAISGAGMDVTFIDGNNSWMIFNIPSAPAVQAVQISGLTLSKGKGGLGGAVFLGGTPSASINGVKFLANTATTEGGAFYNHGGAVTISDSVFVQNKCTGSGRGGGAILTGGPVTIENSQFTSNISTRNGGAISHDAGPAALTIRNSTFTSNIAASGVALNAATTYAGGALFHPGVGGTVTIENTLFEGNQAGGSGAIRFTGAGGKQITIRSSTFRQNKALHQGTNTQQSDSAAIGGAIYQSDGSDMTIEDSRFEGNTAFGWAGAVAGGWGSRMAVRRSAFIGNQATNGNGGAMGAFGNQWRSPALHATIDIDSCTFNNNRASKPNLLNPNGSSGALDYDQVFGTITNSTFSGNSVSAAWSGTPRGSVLTIGSGTLRIESTTMVGNTGSAALWLGSNSGADAQVTVNNSIISGNGMTAADKKDVQFNTNWTSSGGTYTVTQSLTNPVSGGASGLFADLMLTPLQDNGGPVNGIPGSAGNFGPMLTHAPLDGSPVIDAGAWGGVLTSDQRGTGFDRVWGAAQDLGAVEFQITANTPPPYVPIRTHAIVTDTMIRGIEHKSIQGVLAPHPNDLGMDGAIFVFAWLPERVEIAPNTLWFFDSARNWHLFTDCRVTSPYYTGTLQILRDIPVVHEPADLSMYSGAQLYLGYGLGGYAAPSGSACNDMLARTSYVLVKTLE